MHRHMRRIGHQRARGVEHRAGKIQAFLDVDRMGGILQRHAHLLGDIHEKVVEHLEQDRVGVQRADRHAARHLFMAAHHDIIARGQLRRPARFDHNGLVLLNDQRGAGDGVAGRKGRARKDRRLHHLAAAKDRHMGVAFGHALHDLRKHIRAPVAGCLGHLDLDRLDRHGLVGADKAELRLVRGLERGARGIRIAAPDHGQGGVGAGIAQMQARHGKGRARIHPLLGKLIGHRRA